MGIVGASHGLRTRGAFNVEMTLNGNWAKFNSLVQNVDILMAFAAVEGQKRFAEEYRDKVKMNIRTGGKRFGYPELSPKYLTKKLRQGGSSTPLVWSETFLNSVEIKRNSKGTQWGVGIPKGLKRPSYSKSDKNKLQVHEYANVLEHGMPPDMPARPIFSDTFKKDMKGLKGLRNYIEMFVIRKFGNKGFIVNKM